MIDWQNTAREAIDAIHKSLPSDADLKARKKALCAARPWEFSSTSWGRKVWAKHQRKYLERHGLANRFPAIDQQLSPLERVIAKAKGRQGCQAWCAMNYRLSRIEQFAREEYQCAGHKVIERNGVFFALVIDDVTKQTLPINLTTLAEQIDRAMP